MIVNGSSLRGEMMMRIGVPKTTSFGWCKMPHNTGLVLPRGLLREPRAAQPHVGGRRVAHPGQEGRREKEPAYGARMVRPGAASKSGQDMQSGSEDISAFVTRPIELTE